MKTPLPLKSDAYTISGNILSDKSAQEHSLYNLTNRRSPKEVFSCANDARMLLYGLSDCIKQHLNQPFNLGEIGEAAEFMKTARVDGGPLYFPETLWKQAYYRYGGYLPIKIWALPECSTFFPNEPFVQVESYDGFGELAAFIEPLLVGTVSIASARLTLERHLFDRLKEQVIKDYPDYSQDQLNTVTQWLIHDFGMRASSCESESDLLGRTHLLVFNGTDTFNAAYQAKRMGAREGTGTSILALAHRLVQGYINEEDCYKNLFSQNQIGSYVADCYNFKNAVINYLIPLALNKTQTVVVRPDSGDPVDQLLFLCNEAVKNGLYEEKYGKKHGTFLKFIYGDSVNYDKIKTIFSALESAGFAPTSWGCFGIGGWLRNTPNRDILSTTYKLSYTNRPLVKLSETQTKLSVPGPAKIDRVPETIRPSVFIDDYDKGLLELAYSPSLARNENKYLEKFNILQERTLNEFDQYKHWENFGLNHTSLSSTCKKIQDEFFQKYKNID